MAKLLQAQTKRLFESVLLVEKIGLIRQGTVVSWRWDGDGVAVYHNNKFLYRLNFSNSETVAFLARLQTDDTGLGAFIRELIEGV